MTRSLWERFGFIRERQVFIMAAVLAADAARGATGGFSASDVRFFFLLFTNWAEHDVMFPAQDMELTQVRRVLQRLVELKCAAAADGGRGPARGRRWVLRDLGLVRLSEMIDTIADRRRPFDEILFAIVFAASYSEAIRARLPGRAAARIVLDVRALIQRARERSRVLLADLEERVRSGRALAADVKKARSETDALRRLEERDAYQLHRVRPLAQVLRTLPEDLRRFELTRGIDLRVDALFAPLAARARAELQALDAVEKAIALRRAD